MPKWFSDRSAEKESVPTLEEISDLAPPSSPSARFGFLISDVIISFLTTEVAEDLRIEHRESTQVHCVFLAALHLVCF